MALLAATGAIASAWLPARAALSVTIVPLFGIVAIDALMDRPKRAIALLVVATAFAVKSIVVAAVLVFGAGALLLIMHGGGRWERVPQVAAYISACLFMSLATLISSLVSSGTFFGAFAARSIYSPVFLLVLGVLCYVFIDTRSDVRRTIAAVASAGTLMSAYSLAAYAIPPLAIGDYGATRSYLLLGGLRVTTGFFEFQNEFGGFLLVTALTTFLLLQLHGTRRHRVFWMAAFMVQVLALLFTLTLGSLFALIGGMFVYAAIRYRRVMTVLALGATLAGAIVVSIVVVPSVGLKLAEVGDRAGARLITYAGGLNIIGHNPFFGVGPDMVYNELKSNPMASSTALGIANYVPHNQFILTTAELGIVGLLALLGLIVSAVGPVLLGIRSKLRGPASAVWGAAVALVLAFFQQNLTNNLLLHSRIGAMFFVVVMTLRRLGELDTTTAA